MSEQWTIFESKNLEDALTDASESLKTEIPNIEYNIIEDTTKKGLLKFLNNAGTVKIEARLKPISLDEFAHEIDHIIESTLNKLLLHILEEPFEIEHAIEKNTEVYNIVSPELEKLAAKKKKLLESLEHIVRKVVIKKFPAYKDSKMQIDINSQREQQKTELISLAKEMASRVKEKGQPIILDNRTAYERRIIHMALKKETKVFTKSVGEGNYRKLMILPRKQQSNSNQHHKRSAQQ